MQPGSSLPSSEELPTGLYPELDDSSPHTHSTQVVKHPQSMLFHFKMRDQAPHPHKT